MIDVSSLHCNMWHKILRHDAGGRSPNTMIWSVHSRRIDPINLSAIGLSRMPIVRSRRLTAVP
jgi:hypothetical protein